MLNSVFITGCDRGLGLSLARGFAGLGWRVFAGSYLSNWPELSRLAVEYRDRIDVVEIDISSDHSVQAAAAVVAGRTNGLDMVVNNAAVFGEQAGIREPQDYADMLREFNVNALGALRVTGAFLPFLEANSLRRLCYVSSEAGSIERCWRDNTFGYSMSKAALNMGVRILFNDLHPRGYTFRLFHPGWMRTYMSGTKNEDADMEADEVAPRAITYFVDPLPGDGEDRLVMRDWRGEEWPW